MAPFGAMAGACADCWAAAASPAAAAVPLPCGSGSGAAAQASGPAADGSLRLGSGSALLEPNRNFIRPRFFCCMHCAPTPTPGSPAAAAAYLATLSAAVELSWQFLSPQQAARAAQRSTAVPSSHPQAPHTSHLPPSHPTRPSQPSPAQPSAPCAMWMWSGKAELPWFFAGCRVSNCRENSGNFRLPKDRKEEQARGRKGEGRTREWCYYS